MTATNKTRANHERAQTIHNLNHLINLPANNQWQMPEIAAETHTPTSLTSFNHAKTVDSLETTIHFFINDYQFERCWTHLERYTSMLYRFEAVLTPDYSLYTDMPAAMKIWNTYRNRATGAYWQSQGMKVIPTVSWAEKQSYTYCFDGLPKDATLAVSTNGCHQNKDATNTWRDGMTELLNRLTPSHLIIYGQPISHDYANTRVTYYGNEQINRLRRITNDSPNP